MTKPPFPSKHEILASSKRMVMNMGLRVLLLTSVCVILPLIAYVVVIKKEIGLQGSRELLERISHLGDAQKKNADLLFVEAFLQLRGARLLETQIKDKALLKTSFQELVAGYRKRILCLAVAEGKEHLRVQMSSQESLEGQLIPIGDLAPIPFQRAFVYFFYWLDQKVVVIGTDVGEEKLLLLFPAHYLVQVAPEISEWAGTMGIALIKDNTVIVQKESTSMMSEYPVFTDDQVRRILNDQSVTPRIDQNERIAEQVVLDTVPFSVRVDIPVDIYPTRNSQFLNYLGLILLLTVIFGAIGTCFLTLWMARPFKYFAQLMRKAGEGDFHARYEQQYLAFEINVLGAHFNHMLEDMTMVMEESKKLHASKEKLLYECTLGHSIQRSIFPRLLPYLPQFDIAASFSPAIEVAGDFYDLFLHDTPQGKRLFIAIGDASGKGMAACLYSFLLRSMLRSFASAGQSLKEIAEHANQIFCLDTQEGGMFVTVWMGMLQIDTNSLEYASLGHYPALIKHANGEVKELHTKGSAFGLPFICDITTSTIHLHKNDLLFLYTDGWIETKHRGVSFNKEVLSNWLRMLPAESSCNEIITALEKDVAVKDERTQDDRTALAIRLLTGSKNLS